MDQYMHSFTVMGPQRWQITDAANPTVYTAGPEQGGTTAAIAANLALDQGAAGYTNPTYADSARPRPEFVTFPNNQYTESGYAAGVESVVTALGPGSSYGVIWFEGLNEPVNAGLTQAQSAYQYGQFRTAIKAANSSAMALGPCEVAYGPNSANTDFTPSIAGFVIFLSNLTVPLDGCSVHNYNSYNGDFIATDGWLTPLRAALATAGYTSSLPLWYTETGNIAPNWQLFDPHRLVAWTAQLYLTGERFGMPKEHIYWFFDTTVSGFGPGIKNPYTFDLLPQLTFWRVYSEEIFGKTYSSALSFGTIGSNFYRGNVYTGSNGTCVALTAQGNPSDTVTLAISDTGAITYSDWSGNTSTVTPVNGQIKVPIGDLPTYVRLSASCTVSVADVGNGVFAATNLATAATVTSGSGASNTSLVNNGIYETSGYLSGPDVTFWSGAVPDSLTFTWSTGQTIKKVMIRQLAPWYNFHPTGLESASAMVAGKLEYWNGSGWLPCPTVAANHWNGEGVYNNTTAVSNLGLMGGSPWMVTFYDNHWCHNIDFAFSITTTRIRWTITNVSYGHVPDANAAAYAPFGFYAAQTRQVPVSEVLIIQGTAAPSPTYGSFPI
jgi:hypothetical protein